jgi:hypothetical protein
MKIVLAAATLAFAMVGFAAAPANAEANNHCHSPYHWVVGTGCVRWGMSTAALKTAPHYNLRRPMPRHGIPAVARKTEIFDRWGNLKRQQRGLSKSQVHAGNGGALAKPQKK